MSGDDNLRIETGQREPEKRVERKKKRKETMTREGGKEGTAPVWNGPRCGFLRKEADKHFFIWSLLKLTS